MQRAARHLRAERIRASATATASGYPRDRTVLPEAQAGLFAPPRDTESATKKPERHSRGTPAGGSYAVHGR